MISPEQERQLAHGDQRVVCALDDENAYWKSPHARMDHIAYRCWLARGARAQLEAQPGRSRKEPPKPNASRATPLHATGPPGRPPGGRAD